MNGSYCLTNISSALALGAVPLLTRHSESMTLGGIYAGSGGVISLKLFGVNPDTEYMLFRSPRYQNFKKT